MRTELALIISMMLSQSVEACHPHQFITKQGSSTMVDRTFQNLIFRQGTDNEQINQKI